MTEPLGLYIHIPFCQSHCGYCAFAVSDRHNGDIDFQIEYIESLWKEIDLLKAKGIECSGVNTLYIGGGTPSRLEPKALELLFKGLSERINLKDLEEFSFEINPEDVDDSFDFGLLQDAKVTRLSVGVQTMSEQGLRVLGRLSNPEQVQAVSERVECEWKGQLSYDFLCGWPGQDLKEFKKKDSPFLKERKFDHLSIYFLNWEPGTRLERDRRQQKVQPLDPDVEAELWDEIVECLIAKGMEQYEISTFAYPEARSLHNTNTWRGFPYLGLGAGAVSCMNRLRWTNAKSPELYIKKIREGQLARVEEEEINSDIAWQEDLMLSLRFAEGLNPQRFEKKHGFNPLKILGSQKDIWAASGWLEEQQGNLRMTPTGWKIYDSLLSDWMILCEDC